MLEYKLFFRSTELEAPSCVLKLSDFSSLFCCSSQLMCCGMQLNLNYLPTSCALPVARQQHSSSLRDFLGTLSSWMKRKSKKTRTSYDMKEHKEQLWSEFISIQGLQWLVGQGTKKANNNILQVVQQSPQRLESCQEGKIQLFSSMVRKPRWWECIGFQWHERSKTKWF